VGGERKGSVGLCATFFFILKVRIEVSCIRGLWCLGWGWFLLVEFPALSIIFAYKIAERRKEVNVKD